MLALAGALFLLGPLLYWNYSKQSRVLGALDSFVIVAILGMVFFHVFPEAFEEMGWWTLGLLMAGLIFPSLLEAGASRVRRGAYQALIWLVIVGLVIHMALDGFLLAHFGSLRGSALQWAIVLHQIPEGAAIWWLVSRRWGNRNAVIALILATGVLLGGYGLGVFATEIWEPGLIWTALEVFVAGALLHVLLHHAPEDVTGGGANRALDAGWPGFVGALGGVALVAGIGMIEAVGEGGGHGISHYFQGLLGLFLSVAPALLVGYLLAGLVVGFLPQASIKWLGKGSVTRQATRGMVFGIPLPICSCGVVPLYKSLIQRGVPVPAALAFLVATPEIGMDAILISLPLLGVELTLVRLFGAAAIALAVGVLLGAWMGEKEEKDPVVSEEEGTKLDLGQRTRIAARFGLVRVVDDTAPWIIVGLAIAAALSPAVMAPALSLLPAGTDVLFFALLGIPLYVCASGSTPLAAALILAGVSPGAAIAFLLAGPATNVSTFGILSEMHGRKVALFFGALLFVSALVTGWAVNGLFGDVAIPLVQGYEHEHYGVLYVASAVVVGMLFFSSIFRQGTRSFLTTVVSLGSHHHHHHHHHHEEGHHDHHCDHDDHGDHHSHGHEEHHHCGHHHHCDHHDHDHHDHRHK